MHLRDVWLRLDLYAVSLDSDDKVFVCFFSDILLKYVFSELLHPNEPPGETFTT